MVAAGNQIQSLIVVTPPQRLSAVLIGNSAAQGAMKWKLERSGNRTDLTRRPDDRLTCTLPMSRQLCKLQPTQRRARECASPEKWHLPGANVRAADVPMKTPFPLAVDASRLLRLLGAAKRRRCKSADVAAANKVAVVGSGMGMKSKSVTTTETSWPFLGAPAINQRLNRNVSRPAVGMAVGRSPWEVNTRRLITADSGKFCGS